VIDIVVPATRKGATQRLIDSLVRGTRVPDQITVVSNEIDSLNPQGMNVRIIRFDTDAYGVGYRDVALRCNVGIYSSNAKYILISGDDQIASHVTVQAFGHRLEAGARTVWGHHRFTYFAGKTVGDIMSMPPTLGKSREQGVNRYHSFRSCYSGSFGAGADYLRSVGAFDMAFNCRHAGEDQHLGLRTDGRSVFIHEPPYWWHPLEEERWGAILKSNMCDSHELEEFVTNTALLMRGCAKCPFTETADESKLFWPALWVPYDHSKVETTVEQQWA
jgi:hypothetical protein